MYLCIIDSSLCGFTMPDDFYRPSLFCSGLIVINNFISLVFGHKFREDLFLVFACASVVVTSDATKIDPNKAAERTIDVPVAIFFT